MFQNVPQEKKFPIALHDRACRKRVLGSLMQNAPTTFAEVAMRFFQMPPPEKLFRLSLAILQVKLIKKYLVKLETN